MENENQDRVKAIYHELFQNEGYNIYYFNLPYHLDRTPEKSLYSGELFLSANVDRTILTVRQAVKDIRALLKWIKKDDESHKVILAGISLGGYITNMTAVVEKNIDFLISTFYANCFSYTIWNTIPGKHIKKDLVNNGFTYDRLKESWAIIDPSLYKPAVSKDKILLLSGRYDQFVLCEDTDILWEAWDRPKRLMYDCGHAGLVLKRKAIARDVESFLKS